MNGGYTNIRTAQGDNTVDLSYIAKCTDSKDYDPEYDGMSIWDQLGKILDSQDNPFPRDDVLCDDGITVGGITPKDCIDIRNLALRFEKTESRLDFLKRIQFSDNLQEVLDYVRTN